MFGRRLYMVDIRASNSQRRQAAERAAINAPMQGTAADLIKLAMIAVHRWLAASGSCAPSSIMQVHDELVLEVPDSEVELVEEELPGLMTGVAQLRCRWSWTWALVPTGTGRISSGSTACATRVDLLLALAERAGSQRLAADLKTSNWMR